MRNWNENIFRKSKIFSVLLKVPGCYAYVGSGNKDIPETIRAHHDDRFDIDERALETAAEIYAAYAIDYLNGRFDQF